MAHPFERLSAETAPLLTLFGPLAGTVGALVRAAPLLAGRIMQAPPRAIHAIAIALHQAAESATAETLVVMLSGAHPRDLLRDALPNSDARLYRLLDRAALPAWPHADYLMLDAVLRTDVGDMLLRREGIARSLVREAHAVMHSSPTMVRARHAVASQYERERLETIVIMLDVLGLTRTLAAIPDRAGSKAVARRVMADFGRAEAPDIDFPVPPGWTRVRRISELWEHGRRMRLCVRPGEYGAGDYAVSLLMNRSVFLFHAEQGALAQFRRLPANTWAFGQCVLARNVQPPETVISALTAHVKEAGVVLLPAMVGDALDAVLQPLRMRDHDSAEDDAADDVLGLDELAA
ncbi:hypothetical protein ACFQS7_29315 [Dankookia sp. GCM10030260]|uniref:hypothetical protein n=1 Tax=Dankookia sp. GCM10030260 TaxID=3273390 RepID=UPI00361AA359